MASPACGRRRGQELAEHAAAVFGALVENVRHAMAGGGLRAAEPVRTAQLIRSSGHGAVSLELVGLVNAGDPAASYEALLQVLVVGLR